MSTPSPDSNDTSSLRSPEKHPEFYMDNGDVVIRVQNALFKLDLFTLHKHSPIFQIIMPPTYAGQSRLLGFNEERPFVLHEVEELDFIQLLRILYHSNLPKQLPIQTVDEWLSVLKLAHKFQIPTVLDLATLRLHALPLDPIRKIAIWKEYQLEPDLLLSAYAQLCQRREPLSLAMSMSLGLNNFTKLAAAREKFQRSVGCQTCGRRNPKERQAAAELIVSAVFSRKPKLKQFVAE